MLVFSLTLYGPPKLYAEPRVVFLGFKVLYSQALQQLSWRWTHHWKRLVHAHLIAKKLFKYWRYRQNIPRVMLSALEGKPKFFKVCEAAIQSSFFHESIVRFFPINFRIHCQPFWATMQEQLAAPQPQSSIDHEIDASGNFKQLPLGHFLFDENNKMCSFRLQRYLSSDTLFLKIDWTMMSQCPFKVTDRRRSVGRSTKS